MNSYFCSPEEFLNGSKIPTRVLKDEAAVYDEMAQIMVDLILANRGGQTVIICPVGPICQYPVFAEKVNKQRISLKNCWFINMDEYLTDDDKVIPYQNSLNFHAMMDRMLYSRIDGKLIMPENQRIFPEPGKEAEIDALIDSFDKIDCCLTGVGINGHIAFNEPPEEGDGETDVGFTECGTRRLNISKETITNNGANKLCGALDLFPKRCVTLGMKQLLKAKVFKVYLYCRWQWGIMRKIGLGEVTRFAPASYLQRHENAEMVITEDLYRFML